jgi:hypothetical protein
MREQLIVASGNTNYLTVKAQQKPKAASHSLTAGSTNGVEDRLRVAR